MASYLSSYLLLPAAIFIIFLLFSRLIPTGPFSSLASWLCARGLFNGNPLADEKVVNALRVFVGAVLLYRCWLIGAFMFPLAPGYEEVIYFSVMSVLSLCIFTGLFTPISSLLLLLLQLRLNSPLGTYTLGVDVTAMLLLTFILYPAGMRYSIDSIIARRNKSFAGFYRFFIHKEHDTQIVLAKFISFLAYSLLCLYSVLLHLKGNYWTSGEAAIEILASTYLSQYPDYFQRLFSESSVAALAARASMQGMVAWYLVLLPFVLIGGLLRFIALAWLFLFLVFSTAVLQLSTLPYLECSLMAIWFWNLLPVSERLNVLYDDRCNLCDKTIRFINAADIFGTVKYVPLSKNTELVLSKGLNEEDVYKDIYSWEDGRIYKGYDFYERLSLRLPLLWIFYPFLFLFRIILIGPAIYTYVAQHRIRLSGVCQLPVNIQSTTGRERIQPDSKASSSYRLFAPFILVWTLYALYFIGTLPGSPPGLTGHKYSRNISVTAHILGLVPINVFNNEDIGMSYHFFTVTRLSSEGEDQLVPYTSSNGSRLQWHKSDRVYFGNSLKWRRSKNHAPILPPTERDKQYFNEVVQWAEHFYGKHDADYRFDFYSVPRPQEENGLYVFYDPEYAGSLTLGSQNIAME